MDPLAARRRPGDKSVKRLVRTRKRIEELECCSPPRVEELGPPAATDRPEPSPERRKRSPADGRVAESGAEPTPSDPRRSPKPFWRRHLRSERPGTVSL